LLARKKKIFAKKIGRNWHTTKKAIDDYLKNQGIKIILPKNIFNASYKGKFRKPFEVSLGETLQSGFIKTKPEIILSQAPSGEPEGLPPDLSKIFKEPFSTEAAKAMEGEGRTEKKEEPELINPAEIKSTGMEGKTPEIPSVAVPETIIRTMRG